jgi:hypothetical protein
MDGVTSPRVEPARLYREQCSICIVETRNSLPNNPSVPACKCIIVIVIADAEEHTRKKKKECEKATRAQPTKHVQRPQRASYSIRLAAYV